MQTRAQPDEMRRVVQIVRRQLSTKPRQTVNEIVEASGLKTDDVIFALILLQRNLVATMTYSLVNNACGCGTK